MIAVIKILSGIMKMCLMVLEKMKGKRNQMITVLVQRGSGNVDLLGKNTLYGCAVCYFTKQYL